MYYQSLQISMNEGKIEHSLRMHSSFLLSVYPWGPFNLMQGMIVTWQVKFITNYQCILHDWAWKGRAGSAELVRNTLSITRILLIVPPDGSLCSKILFSFVYHYFFFLYLPSLLFSFTPLPFIFITLLKDLLFFFCLVLVPYFFPYISFSILLSFYARPSPFCSASHGLV